MRVSAQVGEFPVRGPREVRDRSKEQQGKRRQQPERLERALALDPRFEHQRPGWPKRRLARSGAWYHEALADDPRNLRAMAWLAETLWREGHVAAALNQLARVREGHIEGDLSEEERAKAIGLQVARDVGASGAR